MSGTGYDGIIVDGCNPSNWDEPVVYESIARGGVTAANATTAIWEGFEQTVDGMARWIERFRAKSDSLVQVRAVDDIRRAHEEGRNGVIIGWQNLSPIEDDVRRLEVFRELGLRIAQLTYNLRNLVGNGCYELKDDGLSRFGLEAVRVMNELGILIDLSHVGDESSMDAIKASREPVAFTHINQRELRDEPRNKPNDLIRALVDKGGIVGANAFPRFLPKGYDSALPDYLDAIEGLIEVAGIDSVGLASDFCEGRDMAFWHWLRALHGKLPGEAPGVPRPDPSIEGFETAGEFPMVLAGLRGRGYSEEDIAKVAGENWLRIYGQVWK